MSKPIALQNLSLRFPHKICFDEFSQTILPSARIGIIGRNGCGKSSLLKMIAEALSDHRVGYVPQILVDYVCLSGGERFQQALTQALVSDPTVLLLDEPTNHLDRQNRQSLMRLLIQYSGTLLIATHDEELLRSCVDRIWHIEEGKIHVFNGNYDDYRSEFDLKRSSLENEIADLDRQKKAMHQSLMKEQVRAKSSRQLGEKHIKQRKWPTIVSDTKARNAQETSGRKKSAIQQKKHELMDQLSELHIPEIIKPKFSLSAVKSQQIVVSITNGSVGYFENHSIVKNLRLSVHAQDRIAITGKNGSGKSTVIKAILGDPSIFKQGEWLTPQPKDIGYLDQHYETLLPAKTVIDLICEKMPGTPQTHIRKHLNDFLFRKNEEVNALASTLSGGEKLRLSLALIAAITPKLLILDEVTNNIDRETRDHVIQVLQAYPGAMIVISHDENFLSAISITEHLPIAVEGKNHA